MIYPSKIQKAVQFASHKHKNQKRKILDYPYITHPLMIFHLVSKFTQDHNVLCAAILHDTVEDTETTLGEIEQEFGEPVKYLVDILSEDKSLEKKERKEKYYTRMYQENNKDVFLIKSADILYNLTDIIHSYKMSGDIEKIQKFSAYVQDIESVSKRFRDMWSENPFFYDISFYLKKLKILLSEKELITKIACGIFPVFINERGEREFLLVKAQHGKVAQPKGHKEEGETNQETAERELFEETGLRCSNIYIDYPITEHYIIDRELPIEKIVYSFIGIVETQEVIIQEEEISEYFWVSEEQGLDLITFDEQKQSFREMLAVLDNISLK